MAFTRYLAFLSLGLWLGAIVYFAIAVAPSAFAVLPTRELAGNVVNRTLGILHWFGMSCGLVFLAASLLYNWTALGRLDVVSVRHALVVAMLLLTLVSHFGIAARMAELRTEMGMIDNVPVSDARRVEFNRLHQWSTRLEMGVLLLGLFALGSLVREPYR